jgi:acyl carrier protein
MIPKNKILQEEILDVIENISFIPKGNLASEYWDEPLTGEKFRLTSVDLVYLYFELEKRFNIRIEEKYLGNYGFNSINSIAVALSDHVHIE